MSTTRHHINSRRRRQAREARPAVPGPAPLPARAPSPRPPRRSASTGTAEPEAVEREEAEREEGEPEAAKPAKRRVRVGRPSRSVGLVLLCLLTVVLGGFAGWAHARAESLRDDPAVRNTALTDAARTSEIKGQTEKAVAALFSYDYADPGAYEKATKNLLTGKAVAQHRALLDKVRTSADQQKAVITTTVTDSAVERVDGDRARVLIYADQSSVSTAGRKSTGSTKDKKAAEDEGTYAGAMLAVDVVRHDGRWLVSGIDTFGQ
jgi:Mce-associated membrane protein